MISEYKEQLQYKAFILHIILDMCSGCKKGREERSFVLISAAAVSPHQVAAASCCTPRHAAKYEASQLIC